MPRDNLFAAGKAIHAGILHALVVEGAVVVEDVDGLKAILHAEVVVVDVVGRGNLQGTRAELAVHILVHDNLHTAAHTGYNHLLALEGGVARVFGMDTHGGIAEDSLRTRGGHHDVMAFLILLDAGLLRIFGIFR